MDQQEFQQVKAVMDSHVDSLMAIEGVVGVAIGAMENNRLCIKVMIKTDDPNLRQKIPKNLDEVPVVVEVTGEIRAF
ncbi:MAG: hypothetical protein ONB31_06500 [candidate division KSB1 bacterium]|nr:hypothetical protein [candidate division KSB1 bacterium]MDZ7356770.1 hypothetical protein [candidate division KSB1 bacterium]MDZ7401271.1 hypothetical protein [candidate division KSB1 bacterium]